MVDKHYLILLGGARVILTTSDRRTDSISNPDINFEIWPKLHDLSCEVTPDVSSMCGEEPVS